MTVQLTDSVKEKEKMCMLNIYIRFLVKYNNTVSLPYLAHRKNIFLNLAKKPCKLKQNGNVSGDKYLTHEYASYALPSIR